MEHESCAGKARETPIGTCPGTGVRSVSGKPFSNGNARLARRSELRCHGSVVVGGTAGPKKVLGALGVWLLDDGGTEAWKAWWMMVRCSC